MRITLAVSIMLITSPLRAQQVPSTGTLPSELGGSSLAQMRSIADTLAGNWAITWIGKDGKVIGEGEEIWKFAPGESAFVEENRSKVHGQSSEDYAAMWWDAKAHSIRGIWCDPTINDEGCSGFTVTLQGKSVVLTGEWEYLGKRQAWHEVFSRTGTTMTQTLAIADPGDELHQASTIRGTIGRASPSGDEREQIAQLTKLATEAGNAYASRDLERLKRLTADDYVQTDVRGGVLDKEAWLAFVKNRKSDLEVDTDNVRVRLYGDMAIVTGHWKYTRKNDGKITHSQWTSVWSRSPEGWKRHAFQNTYVNANADRCAAEAVP